MMSIFGETKKLGWFVRTHAIKGPPGFIGAIVGKTKCGQKFAVEFSRALHVFYAQINVIQNSCFHLNHPRLPLGDFLSLTEGAECLPRRSAAKAGGEGTLRFFRRIINFNPDQVSSTAQTLTSTSPSGNATLRMVSSVISVGTPADFFGHETQIVPVSEIFRRRIDNW